jgi:hypothetical protein
LETLFKTYPLAKKEKEVDKHYDLGGGIREEGREKGGREGGREEAGGRRKEAGGRRDEGGGRREEGGGRREEGGGKWREGGTNKERIPQSCQILTTKTSLSFEVKMARTI